MRNLASLACLSVGSLAGAVPLPPAKVCKVFETRSIGLDFGWRKELQRSKLLFRIALFLRGRFVKCAGWTERTKNGSRASANAHISKSRYGTVRYGDWRFCLKIVRQSQREDRFPRG